MLLSSFCRINIPRRGTSVRPPYIATHRAEPLALREGLRQRGVYYGVGVGSRLFERILSYPLEVRV
jgi:hypothetical protein